MLVCGLGVIPTVDEVHNLKICGHVVRVVLRHAPLKTGVIFLIEVLQLFVKGSKLFPHCFCLFSSEVGSEIDDVSTVSPERIRRGIRVLEPIQRPTQF